MPETKHPNKDIVSAEIDCKRISWLELLSMSLSEMTYNYNYKFAVARFARNSILVAQYRNIGYRGNHITKATCSMDIERLGELSKGWPALWSS